MKGILNHDKKQNIVPSRKNISHPSQQTQQKSFKPTIKVDYIHTTRENQEKRHKKQVIYIKTTKVEQLGVKQVENIQKKSGKFVQSSYISSANQGQEHKFNKKNCEETYQKYRSGKQFSQQLQNQFISKSRSTRSVNAGTKSVIAEKAKLSGYKNQGIKDIVQYRHAGSFRRENIPTKCNQELPDKRSFKYQDLHEVDFRKQKIKLL